jgi:hypothetical protein
VFLGVKYTRDWEYAKLIGIVHYSDQPCTAIQLSNRQKTAGIVYAGVPSPEPIRLALAVAIAIFQGEADETVNELRKRHFVTTGLAARRAAVTNVALYDHNVTSAGVGCRVVVTMWRTRLQPPGVAGRMSGCPAPSAPLVDPSPGW